MTQRRRRLWWGQPPWRWLERVFIVVAFASVALTADMPFIVACAWIIVAVNLILMARYVGVWLVSQRRPTEETEKRLADDGDEVWIVQHDEFPHNTVVGVFANEADAASFAEEAKGHFSSGLLYARYRVGFRFDDGNGQSRYVPRT